MKNISYTLWKKGFLYILIALLLYLTYVLNNNIGVYDWQKEVAFFQYIKESFMLGYFPWFWWNKISNITLYPAIAQTSSFISIPETMLFSPFTVMLYFLDVLTYIKIITFLHLVIGISGSWMLKKHFSWNDQQFRWFLIFFLFSPIIIQHLAIGYTPWLNLFFFPWLIFFLTKKRFLISTSGLAMVLSLVLLQGGVHVFVWYSMLISIYSLSEMLYKKTVDFKIFFVFLLTFLLSLIRIYVTAQAYSNFEQDMLPGYTPLNFIFFALVPPILVPPVDFFFIKKIWSGIPSWDAGIFWGIGFLFIFLLIKNKKHYDQTISCSAQPIFLKSLLISSVVLLFLSFFSMFSFLIQAINFGLKIPFLEGIEKYPFRLAIPAFLGFSVLFATYAPELSNSLNKYIDGVLKQKRIILFFYFLQRILLFIGCLIILLLLVNTVFSKSLVNIFSNLIIDTCTGQNHIWLLKIINERGSSGGLAHFIDRIPEILVQLQNGLLITLIFGVFLFLLAKRKPSDIYLKNELILIAAPLLFSSVMWLSVAISVSYNSYPVQKIFSPEIITLSNFSNNKVITTPVSLVIPAAENNSKNKILLSQIAFNDSSFLEVTSKNALLSNSNGKILLSPTDNNKIIIKFKTENYKNVIFLTLFFWVVIVLLFFFEILKKNDKIAIFFLLFLISPLVIDDHPNSFK